MKHAILIAVLLLAACGATKPKAKPIRWEYGAVFAVDPMVKTTFDELGKDRWEAVWCRRSYAPGKDKVWGYECLFKRPVK